MQRVYSAALVVSNFSVAVETGFTWVDFWWENTVAGVWFLWWVLAEVWFSQCVAVLYWHLWLFEVRNLSFTFLWLWWWFFQGWWCPRYCNWIFLVVACSSEARVTLLSLLDGYEIQPNWVQWPCNSCLWGLCFLCGSLSALIDNRIFNVHGGLSPSVTTLDQVQFLFGMLESLYCSCNFSLHTLCMTALMD
jgi:hypothetical protein